MLLDNLERPIYLYMMFIGDGNSTHIWEDSWFLTSHYVKTNFHLLSCRWHFPGEGKDGIFGENDDACGGGMRGGFETEQVASLACGGVPGLRCRDEATMTHTASRVPVAFCGKPSWEGFRDRWQRWCVASSHESGN